MQSTLQSLVEDPDIDETVADRAPSPGKPPPTSANPAGEALAEPSGGQLGIAVNTSQFHAFIEEWKNFRIRGWVVATSSGTIGLRVSANGKPMEGLVARQPRADVSAVFPTADEAPGFAVELPGTIWEGIPVDQDAAIELFAGNDALTATPLTLTRARVVSWIKEIAGLPDDRVRDSLLRTAEEHIHYANVRGLLDEETHRAVHAVTTRSELHPQ